MENPPCKDCKNRIYSSSKGKTCEKDCKLWIEYKRRKEIENKKVEEFKKTRTAVHRCLYGDRINHGY